MASRPTQPEASPSPEDPAVFELPPFWALSRDRSAKDRSWTIAPLVALVYAVLLLPPEVQVTLAGLKITGYRIVILCFAIPAVLRLAGGYQQLSIGDAAILLSGAWTFVAFLGVYGPGEGTIRGGAVLLDAIGAYLIARTAIGSLNDLRRVLVLVAPVFALSATILMIESVSSTLIFRPLLSAIFGSVSVYSGGEASSELVYMNNERLGLMRAYSGFSHPILAGVTLASILPLYALSGLRSWPLWLGLCAALLCVFSMSSIALLAVAIGFGFLVVDRLKDYFILVTWPTICASIAGVLVIAHFVTDNGIFRFLIRYTFSPHNGRVRLYQWEAGARSMGENPWFGIGYEPILVTTWLPSSLDAHFLSIGVRSGWATPVLLMAGCLAIMVALGRSSAWHSYRDRDMVTGLNMAIGLLLIASMTVAYYAETNVFFMAVLGVGAAIAALRPHQPAIASMIGADAGFSSGTARLQAGAASSV